MLLALSLSVHIMLLVWPSCKAKPWHDLCIKNSIKAIKMTSTTGRWRRSRRLILWISQVWIFFLSLSYILKLSPPTETHFRILNKTKNEAKVNFLNHSCLTLAACPERERCLPPCLSVWELQPPLCLTVDVWLVRLSPLGFSHQHAVRPTLHHPSDPSPNIRPHITQCRARTSSPNPHPCHKFMSTCSSTLTVQSVCMLS